MAVSTTFSTTVALAVTIGVGLSVYPERRVCTWFEFFTDGLMADSLASAAQDVLGDMWLDGFRKKVVDPSGRGADTLRGLMRNASEWSLVEIAAGGGIAPAEWNALLRQTGEHKVTTVLTDLQPPLPLWHALRNKHGNAAVQFVEKSVDATNMEQSLKAAGVSQRAPRMIHFALHHFDPALVRAVFRDVLRSGSSIVNVDLKPTVGGLLWNGVLANKYALLPEMRKRIFGKLFGGVFPWWVVPLAPLTPLIATHDATVSVMRAYSSDELRTIAASAAADLHDEGVVIGFRTSTFDSGSYGEWIGVPMAFRQLLWLDCPVAQYFVLETSGTRSVYSPA